MIGEKIEDLIKDTVHKILSKSKNAELPGDIIETDNLAEVIEKLIILHCRMWYINDAMAENYDNDKVLAELTRKLDICFKDKRPMYVQAINRMVENAIKKGKSVESDSVKLYKGFQIK